MYACIFFKKSLYVTNSRALLINGVMGGGSKCEPADPLSFPGSSDDVRNEGDDAMGLFLGGGGGVSDPRRENPSDGITNAPHRTVPDATASSRINGEKPRFKGNVLEREKKERQAQKDRWRRDPPEFFISM